MVKVKHTFTPKEAAGIAGEFRTAARKIRSEATDLRAIKNSLEGSWDGLSRIKFFLDYLPMLTKLTSYASWLDTQANKIQRMKVTEYRWEWR